MFQADLAEKERQRESLTTVGGSWEREGKREGEREGGRHLKMKKEQVIFLAGGGERDQIRASDRREVIPHLKNLEHAACDCG